MQPRTLLFFSLGLIFSNNINAMDYLSLELFEDYSSHNDSEALQELESLLPTPTTSSSTNTDASIFSFYASDDEHSSYCPSELLSPFPFNNEEGKKETPLVLPNKPATDLPHHEPASLVKNECAKEKKHNTRSLKGKKHSHNTRFSTKPLSKKSVSVKKASSSNHSHFTTSMHLGGKPYRLLVTIENEKEMVSCPSCDETNFDYPRGIQTHFYRIHTNPVQKKQRSTRKKTPPVAIQQDPLQELLEQTTEIENTKEEVLNRVYEKMRAYYQLPVPTTVFEDLAMRKTINQMINIDKIQNNDPRLADDPELMTIIMSLRSR